MNNFKRNIFKTVTDDIVFVAPSITFSPNTPCISDAGIFDTTITGTVTIVGASYEFRATAYTYSSPAGSINTAVSIDNQTNILASRTTIGQTISSSFTTFTPGIYPYQIRVNSNSASGDGGGCIDVTQVV
jgi:hypothetical protein